MFKIPEESSVFPQPAEKPAFAIPPESEVFGDMAARGATKTEPSGAATPAFAVPPEAEVFGQAPAQGAAGTKPSGPAWLANVPDEAAVFPDADKGDDQNWFLRKAITGIVGGVDWIANVAGSTVQGANADTGQRPSMTSRIGNDLRAMRGEPADTRSQSQIASERRDWIKGLVPAAWRETFQREAGADIPDPWVHPVKFLDAALSQSLANAGNLAAGVAGKSPLGIAVAAGAMADQEAAGYADTWAKQAGLPIDFVAGYAKQYGLLSAPVEYAQNAMFAGKGGLARGGKALALRKGLTILKSKPMRALLAAADISLEGVTEVGQGLIENLVARSMVRDWNKQNPQAQLPEPPAWSNEAAWQQFKGGAGMGLIYKVAGGAGGKLRNMAKAKGPAAGPAQAGAFEPVVEQPAQPVPVVEQPVPVQPAQPVAPVQQPAAVQPAVEQPVVQPPPLPGEAVPVVQPPAPAAAVVQPVARPPASVPAAIDPAEVNAEPAQTVEGVDPEDGAAIAEATQRGLVVNNFPLEKIQFDPGRFQYKLAPGQSGQTGSLKGVRKYDPVLGGVLLVWRDPADGKTYVVNGHNRAAKANELGVRAHAVRFIAAGDDVSARAVGALVNIAEGHGNALDAAKFFRDSGYTAEQAEDKGLPISGTIVKKGLALSALDQTVFNSVVQGDMPEAIGVAIGSSGLDHAAQQALAGLIERAGDRKLDAQDVAELAIEVQTAPTVTVDNGPTLFQFDDRQENLAIERARIVSAINRRLSADKRLFQRVSTKKAATRLAAAGNQIDIETNRKVSEDAAVVQEVFNRLRKTADVTTVLNQAAEGVYNGQSITKAVDQAYNGIRTAVSEALGKPAGGELERVQAAGAAGSGEAGAGAAAAEAAAKPAAGNQGPDAGPVGEAVVAGEGGGSRTARAAAAYTPPSPMIAMPGTDGPALPGPVGGPRIGKIAGMEPANDPRYSRLPMRLTAAVRMAKALGVEAVKLSRARGNWRGLFKAQPAPGNPVMNILLRHDLFQLVPTVRKLEIRMAAREQAKREAPNNPDAQREIEEDIYIGTVTQERAAALEKGAPEALKVLWHEIGHVVDYLPDQTLKRGNLLGHIAALKGYMNRMIQEADSQADLIPKDVRAALDKEAQKLAGKRSEDGWADRRKAEYKRLLGEEAKRRGLVTLDEVDQETRSLLAWWAGEEEMPGYYNVAKERYADVFSVLMNNPEAVRVRAPAFWNLWNGYLKDRPEVAKVYDRMQEEILTGEDLAAGRKETREKIKRTGPADWFARQNWLKMNRYTRWDAANYYLFRNQGPIDWAIHKAELAWMKLHGKSLARRMLPGAPLLEAAAEAAGTAQAREALDNFRYASTWSETYNNDATMKVLKPLADKGISMVDFTEYMQYRHIMEDRPDIASTGGIDPAEARKRLDSMKSQSPELFAELEGAAERWFENRSRHVLALLDRANMLDPELMETMRKREAYVAFMPVFEKVGENDARGLMQQMAQRFGDGVTAYIGFQKGWLGDIKDAVAATMQKDRKIIRAAYRNMAARELYKLLAQMQAQDPNGRPLITEAPKSWVDGKMKTKRIGDSHPDLGDLVFLDKGKLQHYYVPKYYAAFMNGTHPEPFLKFIQAASVFVTQPFKRLIVDWAPGAWPWLAVKDFQAYATQTPGKNPITKVMGLGRAIRDARSISTGAMTDAARLAMDRGMVMSRMESLPGDSRTSAAQREVDTFGRKLLLSEQAADQERLHAIREMGRAYVRFGNSLNRTWSNALKIKAMQENDKAYPNMPEWQKRQIVRETAGNPDFLNRAAGAAMLDWGQLYYNAGKEGRMAAITALRMNPRDYLVNSLIWTAAPTILMGALQLSLLSKVLQKMRPNPDPDDEEDLKELQDYEEMMRWIPSWEKSRNNIIPLGWIDKQNKKVMYLRIPVSEGQLPAHGLLYGAMAGDLENGGPDLQAMLLGSNALDVQVGSPAWNIASAWLDYWRGRNPRDSYRGTDVLTDDEFKAGGSAASSKMWKYTYNSFLSSLIGRRPYNDSPYAPAPTSTEKLLQTPVVSGVLGKWVRVSGGFDEEAALIRAGVDQQDARSRLMVQSAVKQFIATGTWDEKFLKDVQTDPYAGQYLPRYIQEWNLRNSVPAELKRFTQPGSQRMKAEFIRRAQN